MELLMSGSVVVTENGMGRYQQEVIVGQHRLIADEPENVGGEDKGPDPFSMSWPDLVPVLQ